MSSESTRTPVAGKALITVDPCDAQGNPGVGEILGDRPTVDAAKRHAEAYATLTRPRADLNWRQFSPTTWGLMDGERYTYILITWIESA